MDSNMVGFMYNESTLETMYHQVKKDDGFIDLGLSLKTLHPQACHGVNHTGQSPNMDFMTVPGDYQSYHCLIDWPCPDPLALKSPNTGCSRMNPADCSEESEVVQSKEIWPYVKVNMEGVIVGRKICPGDLAGYSSLAHKLEELFGRLSGTGLRLFLSVSEFVLFYKDRQENWRPAGDVPWKVFIKTVKRLRIVPKNKVSALLTH